MRHVCEECGTRNAMRGMRHVCEECGTRNAMRGMRHEECVTRNAMRGMRHEECYARNAARMRGMRHEECYARNAVSMRGMRDVCEECGTAVGSHTALDALTPHVARRGLIERTVRHRMPAAAAGLRFDTSRPPLQATSVTRYTAIGGRRAAGGADGGRRGRAGGRRPGPRPPRRPPGQLSPVNIA